MRRHLIALLAAVTIAAPPTAARPEAGPAQPQGQAIFEEASKDFGSVPRGTTLSHNFTLNNPTKSPLRVSGVRMSCNNCMTAAVGQVDIPPGESTVLAVTVDTRKFSGLRKFTCHVQFDKPSFFEAEVLIIAASREDITLTPGQLAFGKVRKGSAPSAAVTIEQRGNAGWQITGVQNENGFLLPELKETNRRNGQATYQLSVKLRDDTPVGVWHADVWLKTNDVATPRIRVPLSVEIEGLLTATPQDVVIGRVPPGGKAERKVVVRSAKPFKVLEVNGTDDHFAVRPDNDDSKIVHVLNISLTAGNRAGELSKRFQVMTDLKDEPSVEFTVRAQVGP